MRHKLSVCCISFRENSILICCILLFIHTAFLVINFLILSDPHSHIEQIVLFLDTRDRALEKIHEFSKAKEYMLSNSGEYFALPLTINIVMMVGNMLAIWGAVTRTRLLLIPWLVLYAANIVFFLCLLVYLILLLPGVWLKVLLFLVVVPVILVASVFWLTVKVFHSELRKLSNKQFGGGTNMNPSTVYTPEPHQWDNPLPIWAIAPPPSAWDPAFLQQIDPRYLPPPIPGSRSRSQSRSRSRTSGSAGEQFQQWPGSSYGRQVDSISLSEKYGDMYGHDVNHHGEEEGTDTGTEEEVEVAVGSMDTDVDIHVEEDHYKIPRSQFT